MHWHTWRVIDIFIPFWGRPEYLYAAVRSVLNQTSTNWRLTVVDDAYPEDVSPFFDECSDERVRYLRNGKNLGIIGNFAKCQALATGDYTVFMGCDDLLLPNYVEMIEQVAARFPGVEIIQPGVEVIDSEGNVCVPLPDRVKGLIRPTGGRTQILSGEKLAQSLLVGDWLYWPSLAFETTALKQVEFLADYQIILDLGLVLDLVQRGARLALDSELAFAYRRHDASLSSEATLEGPRFGDEKKFFMDRALIMDQLCWKRAARAARLHITSRAYALSVVPSALLARGDIRPLLTHVFR